MNLSALVGTALASVPNGVRGSVTISKVVRGTLNVTTGARTDTNVAFTATCVVVPAKREFVNGVVRLPTYEKMLLIAGSVCAFPIEVGMTAMLGTVVWRITGLTALDPTGTQVILYTLELAL